MRPNEICRIRGWAVVGLFALMALGPQLGAAATLPDDCKAQTAADWTACGSVAFDQGRYDDAMAAYTEALRLDPRYWPALNDRGSLAMRVGDSEAALRDFGQALAIAPDHCAEICFNRATALYLAQRFPEAIADYTAVLKLAPDDDQALLRRAICYRIIGNNEAALQDFADLARLKPDNVGAYSNRAAIYAAMGNDKAAGQEDEKALAVDPTYADAYYDRASIAYRHKRFRDAVDDYTTAIQFYAEAANGPSKRVSGWYSLGDYAQPLQPGASLRGIDLYLADAYYWRSRSWRNLGDTVKADSDLADATRIDPSVVARAGELP